MSGGVALNCVANGKLLKENIFKEIWIQPASGDAGNAIGAGLATYYMHYKKTRKIDNNDSMKGAYLGPSFSNSEIENYLKEINAEFEYYEDEKLFDYVANLLEKGNVIGWFNGKMEFGPTMSVRWEINYWRS